jgi:hypothetical protein
MCEKTSCEKCRALEFIDDGIRKGNLLSFKLHEPRYSCVLDNKIILVEGKPFYDGVCKDKTTTRDLRR